MMGLQYWPMLHTIADWLNKHTLLYTFVLFVFSIYSKEIKRFLHNWPRTRERARRAHAYELTNRLVLLKTLHNDSYQLLLFLASKFISLMGEWLLYVAPFVVIGLIREKYLQMVLYMSLGLMTGLFTATVYEVRGVVKQLVSYDQSAGKVQEELSNLNAATDQER